MSLTSVFACAARLSAVTPAELIGPDMDVRSIQVTSLRGDTLHYFDEQRTLRSAPVDGFVQLRAIGGQDTALQHPGEMIWMTDGQQLAGTWVGPTADRTGIRWRHPAIGDMTITLEDVTRIVWRGDNQDGADQAYETPATDTVVLTNGDALTGFVTELTGRGITLSPGSGGEPFTIPYARVSSMTLGNPVRHETTPRHRVRLADNTRVWAEQIELSGDQAFLTVIPPGASSRRVQLPIVDLERIDFLAGGFGLIDLTDLPSRTTGPPRVFGLLVPVRVDGRSVRVHAPGEVTFDLPEGAQRFAAQAVLDTSGDDPPQAMAGWSDFQVVVSTHDGEQARYHITGEKPVVQINTPVSGTVLSVRLDPGVNGPILDRLELKDAVILIRLPEATSTGGADR